LAEAKKILGSFAAGGGFRSRFQASFCADYARMHPNWLLIGISDDTTRIHAERERNFAAW
jgi:hypothetical protein